MPARRFFVEGAHAVGATVHLEGGDAHKIRDVLRLGDGDVIEIVDAAGNLFDALLRTRDGRLRAELVRDVTPASAVRAQVDLAQGVPKARRMDFVVEKAAELGVRALLPFVSERTIVRDTSVAKEERWRRLARSASQQCGRTSVLDVAAPLAFNELLARFSTYDVVLFPWELAERNPLRQTLPHAIAGAESVLVVIGPEGGFSHEEARRAAVAGARLLWLGPEILRTETAGIVMLSVLQYLLA
jgi:16S rRNA (uracil1498-N3)-methyltransferase